jgi:hypothetical protein
MNDNGKSYKDFENALHIRPPSQNVYLCLPKTNLQTLIVSLNGHSVDVSKCALYVFDKEDVKRLYECTREKNIKNAPRIIESWVRDGYFRQGFIETLVDYDRETNTVRFYQDDYSFTFNTKNNLLSPVANA